jgi:hypothetical protein
MVDSHSSGCHVGARREYPLFCNLSAEEESIDLDCLFGDEDDEEDVGAPAISSVVVDSLIPICHPTYPHSHQPVQKESFLVQSFPLYLASAVPAYLDAQSLDTDMWDCDLAADWCSNIAPTGGPLTSSVDPFDGVSTRERTYLPGSKTGQSYLKTLITPKTTPTLLTTSNTKPP